MAQVEQLPLGPIGTNCYVVRKDAGSREAVVVDPSGGWDELGPHLERLAVRVVAILVTHGHWDHLVGVADAAERTGAPVYMPAGERMLLEQPGRFAPAELGLRPHSPDVLLEGGETLELAGTTFEVLAVPGHSPAHLAYRMDGALFSGDVLFAGSVGRTDLPGSDWGTLIESIRALVEGNPPETVVYPGHGPATTLGSELERNPFLDELRVERAG